MYKEEIKPFLRLSFALKRMNLATNMLMLASFYENKEDFPQFNTLKESFKNLDDCIEDLIEPEKKGNIQDVYIYGEKYLTEYKAFKKLPEVQNEYLQKILSIGVKEINDLLSLEDRYNKGQN